MSARFMASAFYAFVSLFAHSELSLIAATGLVELRSCKIRCNRTWIASFSMFVAFFRLNSLFSFTFYESRNLITKILITFYAFASLFDILFNFTSSQINLGEINYNWPLLFSTWPFPITFDTFTNHFDIFLITVLLEQFQITPSHYILPKSISVYIFWIDLTSWHFNLHFRI